MYWDFQPSSNVITTGFGGSGAQIGFDAGNQVNYVSVARPKNRVDLADLLAVGQYTFRFDPNTGIAPPSKSAAGRRLTEYVYWQELAETYEEALAGHPDITSKVSVFAVTDRIPNDGMQFIKSLDPKLQAVIVEGMMAMAQDPGGKAVLKSLYNYDSFQQVKPDFYNDFAKVLKAAGVDPATLVK